MCDPFTFGVVGLAGAALLNSRRKKGSSTPQSEPEDTVEEERARAEAEAIQRANSQLANDQRRRREGSLLSKGKPAAPAPDFNESPMDDGGSPLGGQTSRTTTARAAASLMSRGAPLVYGGGGYGGGGGRSNTRSQLQ